MRRRLEAAIHERGIGRRQFDEADFGCAERDRGIGLHLGIDAEAMGDLDDVLRPDLHHQLRGDSVQRIGERIGDRNLAAIFLVVILGRPVADPDRAVVADRLRRAADLECRGIDEGLEGRARLTLGLGGAVELALCVVLAADERPDGAGAIDRDECCLRSVELLAVGVQRGSDHLLGLLLEIEVDRRVDDEIFLDLADHAGKLVHHHVGDVVLGA
ncbi:hypothetical protein D9M70_529360 [compost metagenome]